MVLWFIATAILTIVGTEISAQDKEKLVAPLVLNTNKVKIEITDVAFVKELDGAVGRFQETDPEKYRGVVVTLSIHKAAGESLTLLAQDFCLHYRYGNQVDVAPCIGLSTFATTQDAERPMKFFARGRGTATTGASTAKSETVYVDVFFQNMEKDTSDIHLLVAQPIGASFKTQGWKQPPQ